MRRSWIAIAAGTALLAAAAPMLTAPAGATSARTVSSTERTVVRPVTASGHAAAGYTVKKEANSDVIDCSAAQASPAAVDADILVCSPGAEYAVACWRSAAAHHVLCLDKADNKVLREFRTTGKIADVKAPAHRGPLDLKLANGVFCGVRDGGAGSTLRQHHSWYATYYCTGGQAVWAPHGFGIDHSSAVWTVELASDTGKEHVHAVRVTRAWLVGTKG